MIENLTSKAHFIELLLSLNCDSSRIEKYWSEILSNYTDTKRFYHNLDHINAMLTELDKIRAEIIDFEIMSFTIWYHDLIYNARKSNNEELSANRAIEVLHEIGVDEHSIEKCRQQILATRTHEMGLSHYNDSDLAYLLDIDLEVLGRDWDGYKIYFQQIRKEYVIYPDLLYKNGRKKAMKKFLKRDKIYHSTHYFDNFEMKARGNIEREIREFL